MSQDTKTPDEGNFVPVKFEFRFVSNTSGHDLTLVYWRPEAAVIGTDAAGLRSFIGHVLGQYEGRDQYGDAFWSYLYFPFGSRQPLFAVEHRLRDLWNNLCLHYQVSMPCLDGLLLECERQRPLRGAPVGAPVGELVEVAPGWQVGFPASDRKDSLSIDLLAGVAIRLDTGLCVSWKQDQFRASQSLLRYLESSRQTLLSKAFQEHLPEHAQAWEALLSVAQGRSRPRENFLTTTPKTQKEKP